MLNLNAADPEASDSWMSHAATLDVTPSSTCLAKRTGRMTGHAFGVKALANIFSQSDRNSKNLRRTTTTMACEAIAGRDILTQSEGGPVTWVSAQR